MEILRFDDAGSTSQRGKKSSRGMIVVGLVATLFGVSTALASTTITINGGAATNVGQGISAVSACDDDITIDVINSLNTNGDGKVVDDNDHVLKGSSAKPKFTTSGIDLSKINSRAFDTSTAVGCGGETLELQIYQQVGRGTEAIQQAFTCGELGLSSGDPKLFDVAGVSVTNDISCDNRTISFVVPIRDSAAYTWRIPLKVSVGLSPLDISYFTLVSRSTS
jgi:hypothetical protein